jgi:hypothetical protein
MEGAPNRARVPIKEFTAKFSTKNECYQLLSQDCKAYCPPKDCVTAWHLRDMATGVKGYLHCDALRHISVPFYHEELSINKILLWGRQNHR